MPEHKQHPNDEDTGRARPADETSEQEHRSRAGQSSAGQSPACQSPACQSPIPTDPPPV